MKIMTHSLTFLAAIALMGCQQKDKDKDPDTTPTPKVAAQAPAACVGKAPSGDLVATRVVTANTTRTEPGLYEGPVWYQGELYFSDFTFGPGNPSRIQKLDEAEVMTTFIDDSGTNGLAIDDKGNIVAATHKFKSLSRYNIATKVRTSVVEQYNGNVFNSPNDLTVAKDGTIFFTDPDYQRSAAPGGQDKTSVYSVTASGTLSLVDDTLVKPNGISLSPKEDVLYVNGTTPEGAGVLRAYPMANGKPHAGKDLITGLQTADGMAVDCHGNLYITEHTAQRVRVFTPTGEQLATIKVDANITNAAFGGADGKTLYLTGAGSVWKIGLDVTGSPY